MRHLSFKTQSANEKIVVRDWYVIDATNQTLGRMSSRIASALRGKNKVYFTPHFDCGDYVIVINSGKVVLTGNKMEEKRIPDLFYVSRWAEDRNCCGNERTPS